MKLAMRRTLAVAGKLAARVRLAPEDGCALRTWECRNGRGDAHRSVGQEQAATASGNAASIASKSR